MKIENLSQIEKKIIETIKDEVRSISNSYLSQIIIDIVDSIKNSKKIRALIIMNIVSSIDKDREEEAIQISAAIEAFHIATLLHDDVMDKNKIRRGNYSVNTYLDNKASVLIGDLFLSISFSIISKLNNPKMINLLINTASEAIKGEIMQLEAKNNIYLSVDDYIKIATKKTAFLFITACELASELVQCEENVKNHLLNFGLNYGISFQILDDIVDYIGNINKVKKPIGNDFENGTITMPIILSVNDNNKDEKRFWNQFSILQEKNFEKACEIINKNNGIEKSVKYMNSYTDEALNNIEKIKNKKLQTNINAIVTTTLDIKKYT